MALMFMKNKEEEEKKTVFNPFAKKETTEEAPAGEKKTTTNPFAKIFKKNVEETPKAEEPKKEETKEAAAEEKTDNSQKEAKVEEPAKEAPATEAEPEEAVEAVEEKPQKKTRKGRKKVVKTTEAAPQNEDASEENEQPIRVAQYSSLDVCGNTISYDEAAALILKQFTPDNWSEYEKQITDRLSQIRIEADMNPGTLKYVLADLDAIRSELMIPLIENEKLVNALTDKDWGVVRAMKAVNSTGSNDTQRTANGVRALVDAEINGQKVNYIAVVTAAKMRVIFLHAIMNTIDYKRQSCITMSAGIKLEGQTSAFTS